MLIIVLNSLITYVYEKIAIWYVTLWWRKRIEKKKELKIRKSFDDTYKVSEVGGAGWRNRKASTFLKSNSQIGNEELR